MENSITNGIKDVWLPIQASRSAKNTKNPIRRIVDRMKISPNPSKEMISLSIGDPTHYKNMLPPIEALEAIIEAVQSPTSHGYAPSFGRIVFLRFLFLFLFLKLSRYIRSKKSSCSFLVSIKLYIKR
jgi:hypothetical protein